MICSKEEFGKYLKLQKQGTINMLDVETGSALTGLTREKYADCIKNYKQYKQQYYGNN